MGKGLSSKKVGLCCEGYGHCGCLELTLLGNSGTLCTVMPKRSHQGASVGCIDTAMPRSHWLWNAPRMSNSLVYPGLLVYHVGGNWVTEA